MHVQICSQFRQPFILALIFTQFLSPTFGLAGTDEGKPNELPLTLSEVVYLRDFLHNSAHPDLHGPLSQLLDCPSHLPNFKIDDCKIKVVLNATRNNAAQANEDGHQAPARHPKPSSSKPPLKGSHSKYNFRRGFDHQNSPTSNQRLHNTKENVLSTKEATTAASNPYTQVATAAGRKVVWLLVMLGMTLCMETWADFLAGYIVGEHSV
ncbi:hypothetical protein MMC10_002997 [Thelotrema lepadinum]|nr:hypothetical protein [Thelotrema lepadinum]